MTKIERRRATVTLHHGNYEHELASLLDQASAALRDEQSGAVQRRQGTRSKANQLARQYDALRAEADETSTTVTVWAIRHDEWSSLADEHPPRDDDAVDAQRGVNMKTFPRALLEASLVTPGDAEGLADLKAKGSTALADLDLSRVHYAKVETAAWNVNVGDDVLPGFSLVSLLKQQRDPDSKQQLDSE